MKLYYAPGTCALACWIALEWSQANYEVEKVKLGSPEYLQVNPLGMVPALDVPNYRIITQANAILQYIADSHPEANLGADPSLNSESEFNEIMAFLTGDFHPAFWPMFTPGRYTTQKTSEAYEAVIEASHARIERVLAFLDNLIGESDHVYKNKKSVADAYAYVMTRWSIKSSTPWSQFPNLSRFMHKMENDPVIQKVLELSQ